MSQDVSVEPYELTACGLDCTRCPLFRSKCDGCRSTGAKHWSPGCEIRTCCVLDKRLLDCSRCEWFPCDLTHAFERKGGKYADAVARLKALAR